MPPLVGRQTGLPVVARLNKAVMLASTYQRQAKPMLRSGKKIRFTLSEADQFRKIGVDLTGVKTEADLEAVFAFWARALSEEQPALLEKIVQELERAREAKRPPTA